MVSDKYTNYLNCLVDLTNKRKIKWRPIQEFIDTALFFESEQSELAQYVRCIEIPRENTLCKDKSFFIQKDNYTLVLLSYTTKQGKTPSKIERVELIGCLNRTSITFFPEYIDGGFAQIQNAILDYWKFKESDYNLEVSDSFEILSVFTEED